jgi:hypothetical protein
MLTKISLLAGGLSAAKVPSERLKSAKLPQAQGWMPISASCYKTLPAAPVFPYQL